MLIYRSGQLAAVIQNGTLEIRSLRDGYESSVGRGVLPSDPHPQWRSVVWSQDESMVACSHSSGSVHVYDVIGSQLFVIAKV